MLNLFCSTTANIRQRLHARTHTHVHTRSLARAKPRLHGRVATKACAVKASTTHRNIVISSIPDTRAHLHIQTGHVRNEILKHATHTHSHCPVCRDVEKYRILYCCISIKRNVSNQDDFIVIERVYTHSVASVFLISFVVLYYATKLFLIFRCCLCVHSIPSSQLCFGGLVASRYRHMCFI